MFHLSLDTIHQRLRMSDFSVSLPPEVSKGTWIYAQLRQVCLDMNDLITEISVDCTEASCPVMKNGDEEYLCNAHGNTPSPCRPLLYINHCTGRILDQLLNIENFPTRESIAIAQADDYISMLRRLYRCLVHAHLNHTQIFLEYEKRYQLARRLRNLAQEFNVVSLTEMRIPVVPHDPSFLADDHQRLTVPVLPPPARIFEVHPNRLRNNNINNVNNNDPAVAPRPLNTAVVARTDADGDVEFPSSNSVFNESAILASETAMLDDPTM